MISRKRHRVDEEEKEGKEGKGEGKEEKKFLMTEIKRSSPPLSGSLDSRDLNDVHKLCAIDPKRIFQMCELRALAYHLMRLGVITPVSPTKLWKMSRFNLCNTISQQLGVSAFPVFDNEKIPSQEILEASITEEDLDLPTWAWDSVQQSIMTKPHVGRSGRSYTLGTFSSVTNQLDPDTRAPLPARDPVYENWALGKAIEDYIFDTTGFTLQEIKRPEIARHLARAKKFSEERKLDKAKEEYFSVLDLDPTNVEALQEYAKLSLSEEEAKYLTTTYRGPEYQSR